MWLDPTGWVNNLVSSVLFAILGQGFASVRQRGRRTVAGDAHATQAQATRV